MPIEFVQPADIDTLIEATEVAEPIPYQGIKYERSPLKFAHVPLAGYLEERGIELPEQLQTLIKHMPPGTFIAGGSVAAFVNAQPAGDSYSRIIPHDIDLFFDSPEAYEKTVALLGFAYTRVTDPKVVPEGVAMFAPNIAQTSWLPVQAINIAFFTTGIEEVLDGFDFTVTHFGIDVCTKELVFNPVAPLDYANRRLLNHRLEGDEASNKRIAKYIGKGFSPAGRTAYVAKSLGLTVRAP